MTGQPITTCEWIDRLAPKASGGRGHAELARPTAAFTRWQGNPTGAWAWRIISVGIGDRKPDLPIVNVPGCPVQPDNFMETVLICSIKPPASRR